MLAAMWTRIVLPVVFAACLASPAGAAQSCLRSIDIARTVVVDAKTVDVYTRAGDKPSYTLRFKNRCTGLTMNRPLVFNNLIDKTECIRAGEVAMVEFSGPCVLAAVDGAAPQ